MGLGAWQCEVHFEGFASIRLRKSHPAVPLSMPENRRTYGFSVATNASTVSMGVGTWRWEPLGPFTAGSPICDPTALTTLETLHESSTRHGIFTQNTPGKMQRISISVQQDGCYEIKCPHWLLWQPDLTCLLCVRPLGCLRSPQSCGSTLTKSSCARPRFSWHWQAPGGDFGPFTKLLRSIAQLELPLTKL